MIRVIIAKARYKGRFFVLCVAFLGALGGAGCGVEKTEEPAPSPSAPPVVSLPLADLARAPHVERPSPGETRGYSLSLEEGRYLHLVVEQLGVDVVATVQDPEGRLLLRVDSPNDNRGPEEIFLVPEVTGQYILGIKALKGAEEDATYEIRVVALHRATEEDRTRAQAFVAYWRARLLEKQEAAMEETAAAYREAGRLWGELGDETGEAWSLYRLGDLLGSDRARSQEASEALVRALDLYRRVKDEHQQAMTLGLLGRFAARLEKFEASDRYYDQSLVLWRKLGNTVEIAERWNDIAILRVRQRRFHDAIDLYSRSIETWKRLGKWDKAAILHTNLGTLYARLGENRLALDQYQQALKMLDVQSDPSQRAVTLNKLGDLLLWTEGPEVALKRLEEALELRRLARSVRGEAVTLNSIAMAQMEADRPREALRAFETVAESFRRMREARSHAVALNNIGIAYERLELFDRAEERYENALALAREGAYEDVEETALYGLARVARAQGKLDQAEHQMDQVLQIAERARGQVWRPDLRSSIHAERQDQYEFLIDVLAERHRREPERGYDAKAFAVSERARARVLLDLLSAAAARPGPEDLRRLEGLSRRINDRHRKVLSGSAIEDAGSQSELTELLSIWQQKKAAVQGPLPAALATLTLQEVQENLLDPHTLVLEYFLGEDRSFLWAVTSSEARFVTDLPGRERIEAEARQTYGRMVESHLQTGEVAARQAAARLSRMILEPVKDLLDRPRLVVVAHGALQVVPFAALPHPSFEGSEAHSLIADHEVVHLPSVSVLAALRSQIAGRRPPEGLLAVVADPVLGPDDERLRGRAQARSALSWRRLPFAGLEAKAILALAGGRKTLAASGFEASRGLVRSGKLNGYSILHFATHGLFNDLHPELSALALSTYDAAGRPVDGLLRAYEVSQLELSADLVVLSACRTALGREVSGEGIVGLTQGFFHTGAPRLVVSLWDVNDRSTSELMRRFYTSLLHEKLPPGQALRKAQLSLSRDSRWHAPYYWAGFVLQGEWQ